MNTEKLKIYPIPVHSPEWYEFRQNGIGGSEAGIVMGLSQYGNSAKMYYEKLGIIDPFMEDNEKMFWGRALEQEIAEKWMYWDGNKNGYLKNYAERKIVRRCRKLNGYSVNTDYPWLFGSVDRLINRKGGYKLSTGESFDEEKGLEIKTIEDFVARQWESGIPVSYIIQVHVYMIIFDIDYFELAVLMNGRYLDVHPIDRNEALCLEIIRKTKNFWYSHIEPAKPYARELFQAQARNDKAGIERATAMIHKYEPDPVAGESYKDFLSQRYTKKQDVILAPSYMYYVAKKHKELGAIENYFKDQKSLYANMLAKYLSDNGADKMEFGEGKGFVHYQSRGGSRFTDNRIKFKVNELEVIDKVQKLNLDI